MKSKETIIFDTYYDSEREKETREFLFEDYPDEWTSPEAIPEQRVLDEIELQNCELWEDITDCLASLLDEDCYLLTGYLGSWRGNLDGGKFIKSIDYFLDVTEHLNDIKIIDQNGHLIIEGSHHDGSDRYELKKLTRKGYELANKNYFANDRELHNTIMKTNFYSALPRFAKALYWYEQ